MTDQEKPCKPCPEGQVRKEGRCVMPEVSFTAFIMSLNTAALFHLGEISDPATGQKSQDLGLVQHTIDTLSLLAKKTTGNLTEEEDEMLKNILYDLKIRYVRAVSGN